MNESVSVLKQASKTATVRLAVVSLGIMGAQLKALPGTLRTSWYCGTLRDLRGSLGPIKENTEYRELFKIVHKNKFQQGQENVLFFLKNLLFSIILLLLLYYLQLLLIVKRTVNPSADFSLRPRANKTAHGEIISKSY